MERIERLLDLVALLLDTERPMSFSDIRASFPDDYAVGTVEASARKFERDKAELLELGIPIVYIPENEGRGAGGYVIQKDAYYLPEIGLNPEELAVLYAAGSAALASGAFPGREDLAHALRKVGFFSVDPLPAPKIRAELGTAGTAPLLSWHLELLWNAITSRKHVDIAYYSPHTKLLTHRRVNSWGLALRRGFWTLVGFCHLRQAVRTFYVHRIRNLTVNVKRPKRQDYEVPGDFQFDDYVASWPWQFHLHSPIDVGVELTGALAPLASRLFPPHPTSDDARVTITVRATALDGLLKYVLSLGPDARILFPAAAVQRLVALASRVLDTHGGIL